MVPSAAPIALTTRPNSDRGVCCANGVEAADQSQVMTQTIQAVISARKKMIRCSTQDALVKFTQLHLSMPNRRRVHTHES